MSSKENLRCHGISLLNTFFILVFTVLPLIFGLLSRLLFSELSSFQPFYSKGEFFLYTVTIISSAYLSYYTASSTKKLFEGWLSIISIVLLVLVSGCYAFIISSDKIPRIDIVKILSFGAFILSVPLFYYSQYKVSKRSPNIIEYREEEQQSIENQLS